MKRPAPVSWFVLAAVLGTGGAFAAENSPLLKDPAPDATKPAAVRAISTEAAGKIAAALPKYTPPAPKAAEAAPEPRESDKPRNGIIRLPSYIVQEGNLPRFKERDLLTMKGRLELALKRHPGLGIGNLFGLNNGIAFAMLEEEERLERQREFQDLVSLLPTAEAKKGKALLDEAFLRSDFAPTH